MVKSTYVYSLVWVLGEVGRVGAELEAFGNLALAESEAWREFLAEPSGSEIKIFEMPRAARLSFGSPRSPPSLCSPWIVIFNEEQQECKFKGW